METTVTIMKTGEKWLVLISTDVLCSSYPCYTEPEAYKLAAKWCCHKSNSLTKHGDTYD